jgi:hypothetical protein
MNRESCAQSDYRPSLHPGKRRCVLGVSDRIFGVPFGDICPTKPLSEVPLFACRRTFWNHVTVPTLGSRRCDLAVGFALECPRKVRDTPYAFNPASLEIRRLTMPTWAKGRGYVWKIETLP